ncbi:MAG: FAD-binding oxidoreductase [Methanosarcinales archaeon]|nr:MAG: FAD-binding oxidoreductase [Methanosarcinales archaeon]
MNRIKKALQNVKGEVCTDHPTRYCYSTDASIYQVLPSAVVCPLDARDVCECVVAAAVLGLPITPRAAGTNLAGSCLGKGIILDFSKNMNRIIGMIEENQESDEFFVDVEPGVIVNDLQAYLGKRGLFLPPDPSSSEICMIGGNVGTKASGARSVKYGTIDDYVVSVEFVSAKGEIIDTAVPKTIPSRISGGLLTLKKLLLADPDVTRRMDLRKEIKTASGYNIRALLDYENVGEMIAHLMSSSVGTLGIFTRIRLKVLPIVAGKSISVIYFRSLYDAGDAVQHINKLGPAKVEMMDSTSLGIVRSEYPDMGIPADAGVSALFVEFEGDDRRSRIRDLEKLIDDRYDIFGEVASEAEDALMQEKVWAVRKALVPILTNYDPDTKPDAFIDDVAVRISDLAPLIVDLHKIFDEYNIISAIYGHAGSGNLHIRPMLNLNDPENIDLLPGLVDRVYDAVFRYNGTMTGEHGMGRLRTMFLEREWGKPIYDYMRQIKDMFDPQDLLNPDVMFSDREITDDIKYPTKYINQFEQPCVNCGYCKSVCPISTVMGGETGSRSFIQLLRFGKLKQTTTAESHQSAKMLKLCLGCLRCATRCPSHASVGELLFTQKTAPLLVRQTMHTWASDQDRFSRYARVFGRMRPITNPVAKTLLKRSIPRFRKGAIPAVEPKPNVTADITAGNSLNVAVFAGCASKILDDDVFNSMIRVLEKSGFNVVVPEQQCCGLPMIEQGMYDLARDVARKNVSVFSDTRYDAIVTACASCTMMLRKSAELLKDNDDDGVRRAAERVSRITYDIGEFLLKHLDEKAFSGKKLDTRVAYHNPCHLAATGVNGGELLKRIVSDFVELGDGCCGGAGTYSFMHPEISLKIFDRKAAEIREIAPDVVVTTCPSCELQFKHGLARNGIKCDVRNIVEVVGRYYMENDWF